MATERRRDDHRAGGQSRRNRGMARRRPQPAGGGNPVCLFGRCRTRSTRQERACLPRRVAARRRCGALRHRGLPNAARRPRHQLALPRRPRSVIGATGDLNRDELGVFVDRVFGGLPVGPGAADAAEPRLAEGGALLISRLSVPQSAVAFGQAGIKRSDPDWYAARLLNDIIGGGGFRGRLMKEIREKRGLAYGVSTGLVTFRHAALILGSVATENARVAQSIDLIRSEWRRMREEGPTEAELDEAKGYLIGSFPLGLDSSEKIASLLVEMQLEQLPIDFLEHRAALFAAVTHEDARRVARHLFDPEKLSFVVVGNPADLTPTRTRPESRF